MDDAQNKQKASPPQAPKLLLPTIDSEKLRERLGLGTEWPERIKTLGKQLIVSGPMSQEIAKTQKALADLGLAKQVP